jgi:hypothetical protein
MTRDRARLGLETGNAEPSVARANSHGNTKLRSLIIAVGVVVATSAFPASLDGLKHKMEKTVKLKSGKEITVMVGEMNGKMMAILPMDDFNDLFERAEGHSMVVD